MRLGLFHWAEYQGGPGIGELDPEYVHQVNSDHAGHYRRRQSSIDTTVTSEALPFIVSVNLLLITVKFIRIIIVPA